VLIYLKNIMTELFADNKAPHILIILTGSLGDVIRGGVVPSEIRRQLPGAKLSWLVEQRWRDVVAQHDSIDNIFVFNKKTPIRSLMRLRAELRAEKFDCVLDMQRILKSGVLARLSGSQFRIGVHRRNSKEGNWLFQSRNNRYIPDDISKVHLYLEFLSTLGLELPTEIDFGFRAKDLQGEVYRRFPRLNEPFFMIVLGSSWDSKDWVLQGYHQLIKDLLARYSLQIVLTGDGSQLSVADQLVQNIQSERLLSLAGQTSMVELLAICSICSLGIGPDSGPAHLTSAFGRPYVTLFGPTDPARVVAWGAEDLVCRAEIACSPCMRRKCPGLDKLCMRLITPREVLAKVELALAS